MTTGDKGAPAGNSFQDDYLAFLNTTIKWFRDRWYVNRILYNGSRITLVVLSAALPVLISNRLMIVATPVSVLVAIIAGLEAQFKPGDQWKHQRSAEIALLALRRDYEHNVASTRAGTLKDGHDPFDLLYREVESFLKAEPKGFWQSRLTDWPQHQP
jgi:hypothetical protein